MALDLLAEEFALGTGEKEAVVSLVMVGATVGALVGGSAADRVGRRRGLVLCSVLFALGAVLMALAPGFALLLVGRFVVGLAVGSSGLVVSVYVTELAPTALRGTLVSVNEVAICAGCLLAIGVDALLINASSGWRWMLGASAFPAALQLAGLGFLPESPRWLLARGDVGGAIRVLRRVHGDQGAAAEVEQWIASAQGSWVDAEGERLVVSGDHAATRQPGERRVHEGCSDTDSLASVDWTRLQACLEAECTPAESAESAGSTGEAGSGRAASFRPPPESERAQMLERRPGSIPRSDGRCSHSILRSLWRDPATRSAILLSMGVALAQNLTFSNAMLYFSSSLFRAAGVEAPLLATVGVGVAKFIGVSASLLLVERVGRRTLLLVGTAVEIAMLVVLTITFFSFDAAVSVEGASASASASAPALMQGLVIGAIVVFIFAWDVSWAPLMWVVCSELLPARARGLGMGLATGAFWASGIVTNSILLSLVASLGASGAFLLIAGLSSLSFAFVFRWVRRLAFPKNREGVGIVGRAQVLHLSSTPSCPPLSSLDRRFPKREVDRWRRSRLPSASPHRPLEMTVLVR